MVDGYKKVTAEKAFCEKTFFPDSYGCHHGHVMESVLIECAAQSVAAHFGYDEMMKESGEQTFGMLVSVDRFTFHQSVPDNGKITVNIKKCDQFGSFHIYETFITLKETVVAEGQIKVFNGPETA